MTRLHASASPLRRRRVGDRQSGRSGQAGLPVLHSLQRAFGNHTIASAIRDGLSAPAQPLDFGLRVEMERRLGHDFGNVRVHVDSGAAARVEARAFAFGDDIVLASPRERVTLPHELTHVAQQRGHALTMPTRLSQPHEPAERYADAPPAPEALHRTAADKTSCADGPLTLGDGTKIANPVNRISAAESVAVHWVRNAIAELSHSLGRIKGGAPIGFPAISDTLAKSMRLVGMNPDSAGVWNGNGTGTAEFVLDRFRKILTVLGTGSVYYYCLGTSLLHIGSCNEDSAGICDGARGASCPGDNSEMALCEEFWKYTNLDAMARVILHEHFHMQSKAFGHTGRMHNIYCYERFAQVLYGVAEDFQMADCPDLT